ncbi:rhamnulokinase family protein [Nocardioides sp. YIM 152315]|uniref:rhamnulokinase n=1 Tax=Nocardioides sp. YIM 152315 TaxID=3031760 RepID=UPI0023DA2F77|nr:rhamnulokinase family protein [Nocardioides sp. YIM 152315]MDF1605275.1 rhamnulokinase [Nocardioides sp. YIM 152315]
MTEPVRVAAVDLGATSGRVMACRVGARTLHLEELHRFPNGAVPVHGSLFWDALGIHREVLHGIREVARTGRLHGIGIDSWAVDYGLLDGAGQLLANPRSHRDRRTDGVPTRVRQLVSDAELYDVTGLQQLPFNTVYQLVSELGTPALEAAERMLLLPDLLTYWLTGEVGAERTNASTTGLYDVRTGEWSFELARRIGLPWSILPPLRAPGDVVGPVVDEVAEYVGVPGVPVISVGSHDTASAVAGVPAESESFAYISSGTWSLVGLELDAAVLSADARVADFTNETGVDGTIRFLRNVMGLWVLSESLRTWADRRLRDVTLPSLLAGAAEAPALRTVVDIDDPRLLAPGTVSTNSMPARIQELAHEAGEPIPRAPVAITRTILDSLALAYRRNVRLAASLAGREVDVVHVVGGGSQNELLCQLTADALGLPVLAGPAEAAALGNGLVQARALRRIEGGADLPDLAAMRALVRRTQGVRRYDPRPGLDWDAAASRLG